MALRAPSLRDPSLGVAIRKGATKYDVSTTDAFKRTLLDAKSIGYLEDGLTGTYLKLLFQRLGIADNVRPSTKACVARRRSPAAKSSWE